MEVLLRDLPPVYQVAPEEVQGVVQVVQVVQHHRLDKVMQVEEDRDPLWVAAVVAAAQVLSVLQAQPVHQTEVPDCLLQ